MSDKKYGAIVAQRKSFPPGEPLFLFRAQDVFAPLTLRLYASILRNAALNTTGTNVLSLMQQANEVDKEAHDMDLWQGKNQEKVKIPD